MNPKVMRIVERDRIRLNPQVLPLRRLLSNVLQMCQQLCKIGCYKGLLPKPAHPLLKGCMFGNHGSPAQRPQGCGTAWR